MYRIYAGSVSKKLTLGHKGENEARCVVFDLTDLRTVFGDGTWEIVCQRKGDDVPYLVTNTRELDDNAIWTLTDVDTDKVGEGRCELRYKVDDVLVKTDVYATLILPSLGDTGEAPSPSEDLINKMIEIKDEAKAAASTAATDAAGKAAEETSAALQKYVGSASASATAAGESETAAKEAAKTASDASATVSEYEALWLGAENWRQLRMHQNILDNVEETAIDVALTNSQEYPHNNSQKTVTFETYRNKTDYYVYPEVIASSGGSVGDVVISDKLVNGFKVTYTGSATSATVRCHVFGGM